MNGIALVDELVAVAGREARLSAPVVIMIDGKAHTVSDVTLVTEADVTTIRFGTVEVVNEQKGTN